MLQPNPNVKTFSIFLLFPNVLIVFLIHNLSVTKVIVFKKAKEKYNANTQKVENRGK